MASQVPTSLNQQVGSLQLSGVAAQQANVVDLIAGGVQYPVAPGPQGDVLIMGANNTLQFSTVTGTEVLEEGQGIDLTQAGNDLFISVDPTTALVPVASGGLYNFVAGTQIPGIGATTTNIISIGSGSIASVAAGVNNVINIGSGNLTQPLTGPVDDTVAIGRGALQQMRSGTANIAIGRFALADLDTGSGIAGSANNNNVSVGYLAGSNLDNGSKNVFIGTELDGATPLSPQSNSNNNVAIGNNSLQALATSDGFTADPTDTTAGANIAIGTQVMNDLTTGVQNIGIGILAGADIETGSNNVCIAANTYSAFTGPGGASVANSDVSNQISIGDGATSMVIGGGPNTILEVNTIQEGYMTSALEICPFQLSFGPTPNESEAAGSGYNVQFPTASSIATSVGLGLAPGWMIGAEIVQAPVLNTTPGQVALSFFNPNVMNVQEQAEFTMYCSPPITEPDGDVATGPVVPPYQLTDPIGFPALVEHSATVTFTRTGNVVQCYINGNTPAINWTIANAGGATTAVSGAQSTVNTNYLSLCTAPVLADALTAQFRYDATNMDDYGRVVALLNVGPTSNPATNTISATMAPAAGSSFSQDFQVVPVRATPEAGATTTPHYMAYPNRPALYLGGCYSYSPLNAGAGDQTGAVGTVRLTVTSFISNASGVPTRTVAVCLSNVTHNYGTTATRGTDRTIVNFTDLVNQSGVEGVPLINLVDYTANTLLRVCPQPVVVDGKDTANNDALYAIIFPENWEANGGGANNWAQIDDGCGEPKISLTYMVIP